MNHLASSSPSPKTTEAHWLGRWFTAARREGFLALLPPEVWHTFSALLSFTGRDGRRSFTLDQLASALGRSREEAEQRLEQLVQVEWQGQPLAQLEYDPTGAIAGVVLAPIEGLARVVPPASETDSSQPEAPVAAPDEATEKLAAALAAVGLEPDQIERLIGRFPAARLRKQLDWLPARQARNPAALLIRAVEQDWGPPREGK